MDTIFQNLNQSPAGAVVIVAAFALVLGLVVAALAVQTRKLSGKWSKFLTSSSGDDLEHLLHRTLDERAELMERLKDAHERIEVLERKMKSAKRYVGINNYDAFDDIGGKQSFALAVYDEEGNGAVLTSQVGREGCRVYGKALANGKPDRHLSSEEEAAIEYATSARARPRISP